MNSFPTDQGRQKREMGHLLPFERKIARRGAANAVRLQNGDGRQSEAFGLLVVASMWLALAAALFIVGVAITLAGHPLVGTIALAASGATFIVGITRALQAKRASHEPAT